MWVEHSFGGCFLCELFRGCSLCESWLTCFVDSSTASYRPEAEAGVRAERCQGAVFLYVVGFVSFELLDTGHDDSFWFFCHLILLGGEREK